MEEMDNITLEEVQEFIKDFPIKPLVRKLIITLNTEQVDGDIVLSNNIFSETQHVLSVGTHITDIKPGDKVLLDIEKMTEFSPAESNSYEKIPRIKVNPIDIGDYTFGIINEAVVIAVDDRVEDDIKFAKL